jgi:molybdopterin biosynthesis enzyme MoaB
MGKLRAVVITASDACSRGEREDASGAALVQLLNGIGAEIVESKIISDDLEPLVEALEQFADREERAWVRATILPKQLFR